MFSRGGWRPVGFFLFNLIGFFKWFNLCFAFLSVGGAQSLGLSAALRARPGLRGQPQLFGHHSGQFSFIYQRKLNQLRREEDGYEFPVPMVRRRRFFFIDFPSSLKNIVVHAIYFCDGIQGCHFGFESTNIENKRFVIESTHYVIRRPLTTAELGNRPFCLCICWERTRNFPVALRRSSSNGKEQFYEFNY